MDTQFDLLVVSEAKGERLSEQQTRNLYENPRLWLGSLTRQRKLAEAHVAARRSKLRRLAHDLGVGQPGGPVPQEYIDEKYAVDHANWNTQRFADGLTARVRYVKGLVEESPNDAPSLGDALEALATARHILDHPHPEWGQEQCSAFLDLALKRFGVVESSD